jgi:hypothetical protein
MTPFVLALASMPLVASSRASAETHHFTGGAQALRGQAAEYAIANVVDPDFTVVAKVRKAMVPKR